jgi:hypothetical protein
MVHTLNFRELSIFLKVLSATIIAKNKFFTFGTLDVMAYYEYLTILRHLTTRS